MTGADSGDEVVITVRKTTISRPAIALEAKTLFNAVQPLHGFICQDAKLVRDGQAQRIDIQPRQDKRSKPRCGCCGKTAPGHDRQPGRRWLCIRLWGIQVELIRRPRRANCPQCGARVEAMPWNEGRRLASKALMIDHAQWAGRMS
jgi:hypothetical protein